MDIFDYLPYRPYMDVFRELEQITDIASLTKEERLRYDESIKIYRDYVGVVEFAIKKGWKEGRKEALERLWEEGRTEEKLEIARKMKSHGMPVSDIIDITGLTPEQIAAL